MARLDKVQAMTGNTSVKSSTSSQYVSRKISFKASIKIKVKNVMCLLSVEDISHLVLNNIKCNNDISVLHQCIGVSILSNGPPTITVDIPSFNNNLCPSLFSFFKILFVNIILIIAMSQFPPLEGHRFINNKILGRR